MFTVSKRYSVGLGIILLIILALPPTRQAVLGLAGLAEPATSVNQDRLPHSTKPVDAATLSGHPGLYYLDASNLTGQIDSERYSAYLDLVAESKIDPDATIYTDKNLPTPTPVVVPTLPAFISGVKAGLGLSGGGQNGEVSLAVVPGEGIVLVNGQVTAVLGNIIDLSSSEVVSVLPVSKGGTGRSGAPLAGSILLGNGSGYSQVALAAGDGLSLASSPSALTYALDNTVCRTSGNCTSLGIIGTGTQNYLAKFTGTGAIGNSLIFDDGTNVGIGTSTPGSLLDIQGIGNTNATKSLTITNSDNYKTFQVQDDGSLVVFPTTALRASTNPNSRYLGIALNSNGVYLDGRGITNGLYLGDYGIYQLTLKGGNVGINTTTPQNKLDVAGGVAIGGYAGVNAAPSNGLIVSDKVGIGVSNPTVPLDIQGTNSIAMLGPEMIANAADRNFSSDTGNWSGTNWSVGSGVATHTAGSTGPLVLSNNALTTPPVAGKTYRVVVTITSTSNLQSINWKIGNTGSGIGIGQVSGVAYTNITTIHGAGNSDPLSFIPSSGWTGTITNISVKELTPADAALRITASNTVSYPLEVRASSSNLFLGHKTGLASTTAAWNVGLGSAALQSLTEGASNIAIGGDSPLRRLSKGYSNISIGGSLTLANLISGDSNIIMGSLSGGITAGSGNVGVGWGVLSTPFEGSENTAFGYQAGGGINGSGNVLLGAHAGQTAGITSNKLYIDNSNTATPLIFGDFATNALTINGTLTATAGLTIGTGGTQITKHLSATTVWDPASINDDAVVSTTVTVTGAVVGDTVAVGFSQAVPAGAFLSGAVTSANTVTISLLNKTGAPLDLTSGTIRADAWQH